MATDFKEQMAILSWALEKFPGSMVTTGLNLAGTVLLDLANRCGFSGDVVLVDTGFHFPQTLEFWASVQERYTKFNFVTLGNGVAHPELYRENPVLCCQVNKVAPLDSYLASKKPSALLNARTRDSAKDRSELKAFEPGAPARVNPLVDLTRRDLEHYVEITDLPVHPLYNDGFLSMGCWPCTKAVRAGDDPRSGRFVGQGRIECGLWGSIEKVGVSGARY